MSKFLKKSAKNGAEAVRKLDIYDAAKAEIKKAKDKNLRKKLEKEFSENIMNDADFKLGKGATEFSSIIATVFTLAVIAPAVSQAIVHPIMK